MTKKARLPKVEVSAKAQAVAKISIERKKITKETIPEDVSRAKAGAWLTLMSPITEWAGLKGDALKFKRRLLRVQQEETLLRVAEAVREKLANSQISRPIPRKILVPAIEKASLEDVGDDVMIERWANLLASAAEDVKVQPRFVGILEELAGSQAVCLERVAFNNYEACDFPGVMLSNSPVDFAEYNVRESLSIRTAGKTVSKKEFDVISDRIISAFNAPGVLLANLFLDGEDDGALYDFVSESKIHDEENLSILESLGLVRHAVLDFSIKANDEDEWISIKIHYFHLTILGVEFCQVCSRDRVRTLQEIDAKSRRANKRFGGPFSGILD